MMWLPRTDQVLWRQVPSRQATVVSGVRSLLPDETIRVGAQPIDAAALRQALLRAVAVEARDDRREFVDRAAEPLAVLLDELGKLRHREAGNQGEEQGKPAEYHWR